MQAIILITLLIVVAYLLSRNNMLKAKYYHAQLIPHAILNSLVFLQRNILKGHSTSSTFFDYQSNYLKKILGAENKLVSTLSEEINQTSDFIDYFNLVNNSAYNCETFSNVKPDETIWVPSLLLQPYIENIFKHSNEKEGTIVIHTNVNRSIFNDMLYISLYMQGEETYSNKIKIRKSLNGLYFSKTKIEYTCNAACGNGISESKVEIFSSNEGKYKVTISIPSTLIKI